MIWDLTEKVQWLHEAYNNEVSNLNLSLEEERFKMRDELLGKQWDVDHLKESLD